MRDIDSKTCLSCKCEFGFITNRRHHCRYCGGLFCKDCADHKPKGVPGYEQEEVRVCDICYFNDMAYIVVYNLMFSGFHVKTFSDRAAAMQCYADVPSYASRVLLKVGTKEIVESHFARDTWRHRVMSYANGHVLKHLKPRIALFWIPTVSQIMQRRIVGPPTPNPAAAATNASLAASPDQGLVRSVMVLFRQNNADATEHYWAFDAESSPEAALADAIAEMARIPNLGYGAVLGLDGTVHRLLRNSAAFTAPSQSAFERTLQVYQKQLSVVCAWHEDGEYHSNYFPSIELALDFVKTQAESVVMLDCNGSVVLAKNCSRSWREGLAKFAGRFLLQRQQLAAVIVCTAHVSRGARNASTVRVYDNLYQAQRQLLAEQTSVIFGMPQTLPGDATGVLPAVVFLRRSPNLPKEVALSLAAEATAAILPQLQPTAGGAGSSAGDDGTAAAGASGGSGAAANGGAVVTMPECQICFIPFNPGPNKPCLCGACGNSVCHTCIRSMTRCAFCRKPIDASAIITNVQLLQLVSGVTD